MPAFVPAAQAGRPDSHVEALERLLATWANETPWAEEPVMPSPSYWPIVIAFAITMIGGGLIVWQAHAIAGLTIMSSMGLLGMRGVYGWIFEPLEEATEHAALGAAVHD